ncbi:phage tail sheath C-terminal domain-containing protein [Brevibacillus sp. MER 51]|uniref:phage tail sheath family protein n=1 Tax=Brevibacillus sp. MER 51 TaxID=2939560 RepID=UPI00203DEFED|nr:phage tail sheath C-terminal domain-containing protein [Brevibacillus sp. MER 51]MCM3141303.1 phage tail sheath family protein [Brevibacillus sp. MER 51]
MRHGVYVREVPTSVLPPATASASLPVVFGTAPVNLSKRDKAPVNEPILCYSYSEAVEALGYSDDWKSYTLCEFMYSHFQLFQQGPIVFINVLDPTEHKIDVAESEIPLAKGVAKINQSGVLVTSLVVKLAVAGQPLEKGKDYAAAFDEDGNVIINRISGGAIPDSQTSLTVSFTKLEPSKVIAKDIIGGVDVTTGQLTGLELVQQVFPRFRLLPGLLLAPGWSQDPVVGAVMKAKSTNINGHFRCMALLDIPTDTIKKYTDAPAWKEQNNYTAETQAVCYPKLKLGDHIFHQSTQLAGVICQVDQKNEGVPYESPSNKSYQANSAVLDDGTEVLLGLDQANYLNGQGIVSPLNFTGGWKCWGNRTAAYPAVTDPVKSFIPVRRMFDWIGNSLILTFWQKVDDPANKRLVQTVIDSVNIWLNGLQAAGYILGGRVEFVKSENPVTDLMNGTLRFHVFVTPASPAEEIQFLLEYDPSYLGGLFA